MDDNKFHLSMWGIFVLLILGIGVLIAVHDYMCTALYMKNGYRKIYKDNVGNVWVKP